jgi:hypothetical protein
VKKKKMIPLPSFMITKGYERCQRVQIYRMHWGMRTTFNNGLNGVSHARRQIPEDYSAQVLHLMVSTLWFKAYLPPTKRGRRSKHWNQVPI